MAKNQNQIPQGRRLVNLRTDRVTTIERPGSEPLAMRLERHRGKVRVVIMASAKITHAPADDA